MSIPKPPPTEVQSTWLQRATGVKDSSDVYKSTRELIRILRQPGTEITGILSQFEKLKPVNPLYEAIFDMSAGQYKRGMISTHGEFIIFVAGIISGLCQRLDETLTKYAGQGAGAQYKSAEYAAKIVRGFEKIPGFLAKLPSGDPRIAGQLLDYTEVYLDCLENGKPFALRDPAGARIEQLNEERSRLQNLKDNLSQESKLQQEVQDLKKQLNTAPELRHAELGYEIEKRQAILDEIKKFRQQNKIDPPSKKSKRPAQPNIEAVQRVIDAKLAKLDPEITRLQNVRSLGATWWQLTLRQAQAVVPFSDFLDPLTGRAPSSSRFLDTFERASGIDPYHPQRYANFEAREAELIEQIKKIPRLKDFAPARIIEFRYADNPATELRKALYVGTSGEPKLATAIDALAKHYVDHPDIIAEYSRATLSTNGKVGHEIEAFKKAEEKLIQEIRELKAIPESELRKYRENPKVLQEAAKRVKSNDALQTKLKQLATLYVQNKELIPGVIKATELKLDEVREKLLAEAERKTQANEQKPWYQSKEVLTEAEKLAQVQKIAFDTAIEHQQATVKLSKAEDRLKVAQKGLSKTEDALRKAYESVITSQSGNFGINEADDVVRERLIQAKAEEYLRNPESQGAKQIDTQVRSELDAHKAAQTQVKTITESIDGKDGLREQAKAKAKDFKKANANYEGLQKTYNITTGQRAWNIFKRGVAKSLNWLTPLATTLHASRLVSWIPGTDSVLEFLMTDEGRYAARTQKLGLIAREYKAAASGLGLGVATTAGIGALGTTALGASVAASLAGGAIGAAAGAGVGTTVGALIGSWWGGSAKWGGIIGGLIGGAAGLIPGGTALMLGATIGMATYIAGDEFYRHVINPLTGEDQTLMASGLHGNREEYKKMKAIHEEAKAKGVEVAHQDFDTAYQMASAGGGLTSQGQSHGGQGFMQTAANAAMDVLEGNPTGAAQQVLGSFSR